MPASLSQVSGAVGGQAMYARERRTPGPQRMSEIGDEAGISFRAVSSWSRMMDGETGSVVAVLLRHAWLVMPILSAGAHWVCWQQLASIVKRSQVLAEGWRRFVLLSA
jgi:hypothetical protein